MDLNTKLIYSDAHGLWFPENERRVQKCYDAQQTYINSMDYALSLIPPKRRLGGTCVQAGGHIGVWPIKLASYFKEVFTFEPDPPVFQALKRNVEKYPNIVALPLALGAAECVKEFSYYTGRTAVSTMKEVLQDGDLTCDVQVTTVDSLNVKYLAALLLDVEGYEPQVLEGARKTILRDHPVIMCELLARSTPGIMQQMEILGYKRVINPANRKERDGVFVWQQN
jgi:FkbM family methyltransferase